MGFAFDFLPSTPSGLHFFYNKNTRFSFFFNIIYFYFYLNVFLIRNVAHIDIDKLVTCGDQYKLLKLVNESLTV